MTRSAVGQTLHVGIGITVGINVGVPVAVGVTEGEGVNEGVNVGIGVTMGDTVGIEVTGVQATTKRSTRINRHFFTKSLLYKTVY